LVIAETVGVGTYEEWRLIFETSHGKGVDRIVSEALAATPQEVDIHQRRKTEILVYAYTEEEVHTAGALLSALLGEAGISASSSLARWNPDGERWQDPVLPVEPAKYPIAWDWAELGELGWEVRVRVQSREDARRVEEELREGGRPTTSDGSKRVMAGTRNEEDARALADQIRLGMPFATMRFVRLPVAALVDPTAPGRQLRGWRRRG
jgi:hypothetical protein